MLIIWDIHATWSIIDRLIDSIRSYVQKHAHEQTIVFVWDYVYHFSYDRKVLLQFFRFLLELVQQEKHVYVLAWNHDWIAQHFVFSEWEELLSILDTWQMSWLLHFITKPSIVTIEWLSCIFFPYCSIEKQEPCDELSQTLIGSTNKKEQRSWNAHVLLKGLVDRAVAWSPDKKVLLIHHRYINATAFPWQFATFSFRSPALSEQWLDDSRLFIISWHLHQPFLYKNYLCVGSVWFSSPLETNQCKYFFQLQVDDYVQNNAQKMRLQATEVWLHPYCTLPFSSKKILINDIETQIDTNRQAAKTYLHAPDFLLWNIQEQKISYKDLHVFITHQWTVQQDLLEYCDQELVQMVDTVSIKSKHMMMHELVSSLYDASLSLDESIADWKTLLWSFLVARYWEEEAAQYQSILEQLDIL